MTKLKNKLEEKTRDCERHSSAIARQQEIAVCIRDNKKYAVNAGGGERFVCLMKFLTSKTK